MYQGRNLKDLAEELTRQLDTKKDYVADTRQMTVSTLPLTELKTPGLSLQLQDIGTMPVNNTFHNQMATKLDIPKRYYDRLLSSSPELLAENINYWLQKEPKQVMIRTLDNKARALLSNRYRTIDNYDIVQAVLKPILEAGCKIVSCELTEYKVYIKAIAPTIRAEIKKGDIVEAGVVIRNSEIGYGSVSIDPMVNRLVCLNGMIVNDYSLKKTHLGKKIDTNENVAEFFRDETRLLDDKSLLMKIEDVVTGTLSNVKFDLIVNKMRESTEEKITINPVKMVERVSKNFNFNENEGGDIMCHLIEGADLSKYGLMNAVTRASQDSSNYDRATELEEIGGKILDITPDNWQALNA